MNPDHVAAVTALVTILERIGAWPIGTLMLASVVGPWVMMFLLARSQERRVDEVMRADRERFEEVTRMYESNVRLVEDYEKTAKSLHDLVIMNTQALTRLLENLGKGRT